MVSHTINLIACWANLGFVEESVIHNHLLQSLISHPKLYNHQAYALIILFRLAGATFCQGITPSNSKGGLPAPEAGARAEEEGIRDEIDPSPSRSESSQDKAEPQAVGLTQPPRESREERTRRPH